MRKLVLILIAFIAVVTFIRAFDNSAYSKNLNNTSAAAISESLTELESTH